MFDYEIHVKTPTYLQKINVILYIHIFDGRHIDYIDIRPALMKYS